MPSDAMCSRKLLVLHGSRQTGQLLIGRMEKLKKRLKKKNIELVAPDAPCKISANNENETHLLQWWERHDNEYQGLMESVNLLETLWSSSDFEGIIGFSQGARLAHLIALCHASDPTNRFPGLRYIIFVAGYMAPDPTDFDKICTNMPLSKLDLPSLHVWGINDPLISPQQSREVSEKYVNPQIHEHDGKHFVPMKADNVNVYEDFVTRVMSQQDSTSVSSVAGKTIPDEETAQMQQDEVEALCAIYPEEFKLLSVQLDEDSYEHPICYEIAIVKDDDGGIWPPKPVALRVECPPTYPLEAVPNLSLSHENNVFEFSSSQTNALLEVMHMAATAELGNPSILACIYAAREYFESGAMELHVSPEPVDSHDAISDKNENIAKGDDDSIKNAENYLLKPSPAERIHHCNLEGLAIAESILKPNRRYNGAQQEPNESDDQERIMLAGKGGSWKFCIGLVGKPSAGKSTFFNAATCFARQRGGGDESADNHGIGGATMAPHPFTTIDPNVGFCLVPAPLGLCPEENLSSSLNFGSTHGRDWKGRRLLPVMLKDVAGLVPGAYQGRGRGNKFLNDLTDADVLIHVMDASGTADTEGNTVGYTEDGIKAGAGSHPLNDLNWIRNELIEWVYTNLMFKWDTIKRRGKDKLSGMFSGYGQNEKVQRDILHGVEKFLEEKEHRDRALAKLDEWDEGDVHRLVSAFLGVRFPMALALNKSDLPSASQYIEDVQKALPVDGAHVGVPLCARKEMSFVRNFVEMEAKKASMESCMPPTGVLQCLHSAMSLREPILVFPVSDMTTYAPLPGLADYAINDASLPSAAMISCLKASGGASPSLWDANKKLYNAEHKAQDPMLRDVLVMKPGSTVEDVFFALKRMGALGGEFVRAEGAGDIGDKGKLIPKTDIVGRNNRILKIMTNKRREWQTKI